MRTKAAILLGFIAIGMALIVGGIALPPAAAGICRGAIGMWLFTAVVVAIARPFIASVRQGYQEALSKPAGTSAKDRPKSPAPPPRTPMDRRLAMAETAVAVILFLLLLSGAEVRRGSLGQSSFFLTALVFTVLAVMRFAFSVRSGHDEALREQWEKTGRCLTCGYDLRFNTSNICPECGKPVPSI
jgi:hypothetical protein